MTREEINTLIAKDLLKIKAVFFRPDEPFTWASGWKSPIYTDNRKTLGYSDVRSFVKLELCHLIQQFANCTLVHRKIPALLSGKYRPGAAGSVVPW